jgi:hypothetical protein
VTTDIEVAIGRKNHPVDATLDEGALRQFVGELDSACAIGRATSLEPVDRRTHRTFVACRFQDAAARPRVNSDCHRFFAAKLINEQTQRILDQWKFVFRLAWSRKRR